MNKTMNGAMAPPTEDPLSKNAVANARSRLGNHSDTALVAAGQFADSPKPSRNRNAQKLRSPPAREVNIATAEYQSTEKVSPRRVPTWSISRPHTLCPIAYARRKEIT